MQALKPDTLISNPQGCLVVSSVDIAAPAASVWNIVGNFAGFPVFIPALAHIEMTGSGVRSVRKKLFKDGNVVIEQLNSRDDQAMNMTWSLIYTSLNIGNLWAAMQVQAIDASHSRATWTIQAEPWEGGPQALPGFQAFLQGLADEAMGNVRNLLS
ncbi:MULTISPECIES: SRPBCC family protein [unclassified Pseudomonas]|uniref:SRPBCC family protein n=1 Tax=unclassified Pseudomonas TaxID=196821 RepID=UPI002447E9D7|nr:MULTISPECIES: SRPBCC family protein [unclassified Pseudomonas]MDH0305344.1 SRPBCC family protein [Pseudomonas sp. GD04091]MDH1988278.1 SRPBCC family protein [Pseudomonas sp. GD03689]